MALKVLPDSLASDPDRLARFTREAQTLALLNHPNIAYIHGLEEFDGMRALVMELVEGEDLAQRITRGPVPVEKALFIGKQIADALAAAHKQRIIHRDLKPANIQVRADGTVKVLDFGLAKALDQGTGARDQGSGNVAQAPTTTAMHTGDGLVLGTVAYMSPEQARGQVVDKRADIWAFGCVLYEMVAGQPPFIGLTVLDVAVRIASETPPPLSTVPASVRAVIDRCLAKAPEDRYQDASELRRAFDNLGHGHAPRAVRVDVDC